MLDEVKNIIIVLSGKGGVGKSTVSTQLALTLRENGFKVGLLDIDLCGPSVPHILGLEGESVHQGEAGWVPVYMDKDQRLAVMSVAFLLKTRNSPVIWRGPKKTAMIKQFLDDVYWQDLDYLVIDTPPGTSDEHLTVMEVLSKSKAGIVVVTTPQHLALDDVRKQLSFCKGTPLKVLGLIENMSGYVCPTCDTCSTIWGSGGGEQLAQRASIPFLGSLPIDPKLALLAGNGGVSVRDAPDRQVSKVLQIIAQSIVGATPVQAEDQPT